MRTKFVQKLAELVELSDDEAGALDAAVMRPRDYPARKDLIREGDETGPVFVVLEGWCCRYKILPNGGRQIMAFLMPGDCCDLHISMVERMDHGIQTITATKVATVSRQDMTALMDKYPRIARAMYTAQLIDEGILRAWIVSMGRRSSVERVAHLMCELYLRAHNIGLAGGAGFSLPLSQLVLADALGMTAVHINRVLRELRERGAMKLSRGQLEIIDPVKLTQIAGFDENYLHRRLREAA